MTVSPMTNDEWAASGLEALRLEAGPEGRQLSAISGEQVVF